MQKKSDKENGSARPNTLISQSGIELKSFVEKCKKKLLGHDVMKGRMEEDSKEKCADSTIKEGTKIQDILPKLHQRNQVKKC